MWADTCRRGTFFFCELWILQRRRRTSDEGRRFFGHHVERMVFVRNDIHLTTAGFLRLGRSLS